MQVDTESLLEETLFKNPQLLIPGLSLVGRQTPAPVRGGALDILGLDRDGKPVVFELNGELWQGMPWPRLSTMPPSSKPWI